MTGRQISLTERLLAMVLPGSSVLRRQSPTVPMKSAVRILCPSPSDPPNSSSSATFPNKLGGAGTIALPGTVWGGGRVAYVDGVDDR
jgi:hypothetical protein